MDIYLREIEARDIDFIYRGLSDPDVVRHYGVSFDSLESTGEQMDWYDDLISKQKGHWWIICDKSTNQALGAGGFNDWDHQHHKAEVGFWLVPEYWGKGIMKKGMNLLLDIGFNQMNINRVEGFVEPENLKCVKALEKIGFKHEAHLRDYEIKDGKYQDIAIYSYLKSEFNHQI